MNKEREFYLTISEIANAVGAGKSAVEKWGLPTAKNRGGRAAATVDYRDVMSYLYRRVSGKENVAGSGSNAIDVKLENAKIAKHKARLMELEVEESEGRLVQADEVLRGYTDALATIRAAFVALPTKIAKQVEGLSAVQIKQRLKQEIDGCLVELAEEIMSRGGVVSGEAEKPKVKRRKVTKAFSTKRKI